MRARCNNPKHRRYPDYGGRGIGVDPRWDRFENFFADMGPRPEGMTLERIDNDKGYTPGNCRWATRAEQATNKRNNRVLTYQGETMCTADWARKLGVNVQLLRNRLHRGWPIERVLMPPIPNDRTRYSK